MPRPLKAMSVGRRRVLTTEHEQTGPGLPILSVALYSVLFAVSVRLFRTDLSGDPGAMIPGPVILFCWVFGIAGALFFASRISRALAPNAAFLRSRLKLPHTLNLLVLPEFGLPSLAPWFIVATASLALGLLSGLLLSALIIVLWQVFASETPSDPSQQR